MEPFSWEKVTSLANQIAHLQSLRKTGGFFPIVERARFLVQGNDRMRYLNGQVTCDLFKLEPGRALPACLLTPKGKLCATIFVWLADGDFIIETDFSLREQVLARLERYIIADDVTVSSETLPMPIYHVFGYSAPERELRISRLGVEGYDTSELPHGIPLASPQEIELLRIERGIPHWGREIHSDSLPQEAYLEVSSVDFEKGCYVGQEVMSRLKSIGRVNKRLFGFIGTLEGSSNPPLTLYASDRPDMEAGVLTSWANHFELAKTVALGYLNRQLDSFERFTVVEPSGRALGVVEKCQFPILL